MTRPHVRAVPDHQQPREIRELAAMSADMRGGEQLLLARERTELLRQLTAVAAAGFVLAATALVATAGRWAVVALRR